VKVFELAKELGITHSDMVARLDKLGFGTLAPSSDLDVATADKVRAALTAAPATESGGTIALTDSLTVKELGEKLGVGSGEVQKVLMGFGVLAGLNQRLDSGAMVKIAKKLGKSVTVGFSGSDPGSKARSPHVRCPARRGEATPHSRADGGGGWGQARRSADASTGRDDHGACRPRQDDPAGHPPQDEHYGG
jgi:hypothetical protein